MMTLQELKPGQSAVVTAVGGEGALRQHFLDMGVIPGASLTVTKFAPMGDPMELLIHGYELTLRLADAGRIQVRLMSLPERAPSETQKNSSRVKAVQHPGLGEGGRFHDRSKETPLPDGTTLTFALVGNQNCGKTTLFNQLTGSNQHVGNFPGVTVDRKDGVIKGHPRTLVTDLPGIYSLSPYTSEEQVSRAFILESKPHGIINIVDATNIERNLYLTMQLLELDTPMVLVLNMMDEVRANGGSILINKMEQALSVPVIPISAARGEGINEMIDHAIHVAKYQERPVRQDFCDRSEDGGAVHRCLHGIMHLIEDHAAAAGLPLRFAAGKLAEGDRQILEALNLSDNEKEMIEHIIVQMETERGLDRAAAMADMRFDFIDRLCSTTVVKPQKNKGYERSRKIDRVLTGRYTAVPAFAAIMALVFWLTFNVIGPELQELLARFIGALSSAADEFMAASGVNALVRSLTIDGIFSGVGSVISFLPIIVVLFFFLSMLEDSGYMARIAFVMDHLLRKIGLSGRSIVPMLIGFGCTVPAVMASRTLPSERDRRMTIMLTPFMSCSAKLPIYVFFSAAFFPKFAGAITVALYLLGILAGVAVALLSKNTVFKGEAVPFVMELPNYRLPGVENTLRLMWEKARDFIERAFTVIFIGTVVVWFLQTFDFHLNVVTDSRHSMLAAMAGTIAPLFAPLGFGDWRISTALMTGVLAKESVVSTLSVVLGGADKLSEVITPLGAASFLVFCLLYTPCIAAIASIRRELGNRWALGVALWQCLMAWLAAWAVKLIGNLFGVI
ncbi:MAG: ferrous iron transport protein B [Pyramidobacter sp.]|jgi:ferrous iron transport protein B